VEIDALEEKIEKQIKLFDKFNPKTNRGL